MDEKVTLFLFSVEICDAIKHYIDGLLFFEIFILLAYVPPFTSSLASAKPINSVMMIYKYWDSITKEDLEFSVGNKATVWEVKDDPSLKGTSLRPLGSPSFLLLTKTIEATQEEMANYPNTNAGQYDPYTQQPQRRGASQRKYSQKGQGYGGRGYEQQQDHEGGQQY